MEWISRVFPLRKHIWAKPKESEVASHSGEAGRKEVNHTNGAKNWLRWEGRKTALLSSEEKGIADNCKACVMCKYLKEIQATQRDLVKQGMHEIMPFL